MLTPLLDTPSWMGLEIVVVPEGEIITQEGTGKTETVRTGTAVRSKRTIYLTEIDLCKMKLNLQDNRGKL